MNPLPEYADGRPNLCGSEPNVEAAILAGRQLPAFHHGSRIDFGRIRDAFAITLPMHQSSSARARLTPYNLQAGSPGNSPPGFLDSELKRAFVVRRLASGRQTA